MLFRLPSEEELTDNKLNEFIAKHNAECAFRFKHLKDAYETDYQIFHQKPKPDYKPDNRIAVNFAKYMVDTFNGYFIGNPIKISVDGDAADNIKKYVELLDQYNDQDDNNAELSKICCIYGKGYEMYYVDELGNIGITYLTPFDAFMIYDDSVLCREQYFVRLYMPDMQKKKALRWQKPKSAQIRLTSMPMLERQRSTWQRKISRMKRMKRCGSTT